MDGDIEATIAIHRTSAGDESASVPLWLDLDWTDWMTGDFWGAGYPINEIGMEAFMHDVQNGLFDDFVTPLVADADTYGKASLEDDQAVLAECERLFAEGDPDGWTIDAMGDVGILWLEGCVNGWFREPILLELVETPPVGRMSKQDPGVRAIESLDGCSELWFDYLGDVWYEDMDPQWLLLCLFGGKDLAAAELQIGIENLPFKLDVFEGPETWAILDRAWPECIDARDAHECLVQALYGHVSDETEASRIVDEWLELPPAAA